MATELRPARRRRPARVARAGLTAIAVLLLTAGLSMTSAHAAVTSAAKTPGAIKPATLGVCEPGKANTDEFVGWCTGSGTTSYRAIALCSRGDAVYGVERYDGNPLGSVASCQVNNLGDTLSSDDEYGYLECTNDNGSGTYAGYQDIGSTTNSIGEILLNWGNGNIATGGTTLCDLDPSGSNYFNPNIAP